MKKKRFSRIKSQLSTFIKISFSKHSSSVILIKATRFLAKPWRFLPQKI